MTERSWNFLDKYGHHYGGSSRHRPLLPEEVIFPYSLFLRLVW